MYFEMHGELEPRDTGENRRGRSVSDSCPELGKLLQELLIPVPTLVAANVSAVGGP